MDEDFHRRVIQITARDSPNVRFAEWEISKGKRPSGRVLVPGVLTWDELQKRRRMWDPIRQCIGLDACFWEGKDVLMYPPEWLNAAEELGRVLRSHRCRKAKGIGVDPGEGGANTAMTAVDELGVIEVRAERTPNTNRIPGMARAFAREHGITEGRLACMDRGGGGKQHADRLRDEGFAVRTVAFGESLSLDPVRRMRRQGELMDVKEERYVYKNRRAQMAHELRLLIEPDAEGRCNWGLVEWEDPVQGRTLRQQLAPVPLRYDGEGRLFLPPKSKKDAGSDEETLTDLIGYSPDEWDSLMLACHAMLHEPVRMKAGAI